MKRILFIAVLIASILASAAGCAPSPAAQAPIASTAVSLPIAGQPVEPAARLTPGASPTAAPDLETQEPTLTRTTAASLPPATTWPPPPEKRTRYTLNARLDYNRHSLEVVERIEYTNTTGETLKDIPLVVEALRYPRTFELAEAADANGKPLRTKVKDTTLTLTLPAALSPGDITQFTLQYSLSLPDVNALPQLRPYPLGYTGTQINFGDWYPFVPPYVAGKGWLIHPPASWGEHLVEAVADFDVSIQLVGNLTDLVVAAGAQAEEVSQPDGEWLHYTHTARRNFAWSASPYYEVVTQTVQTEAGSSVLLASYYFSFHERAGKSLLEAMAQSVPLYSRLFGDYPHAMLAGVQADFMDGMEYDGLYFLSTDYYNWYKDPPADFLVALAAHETAHQWWMGLVGNDPAQEPWLDEAVCTYSELIYYENVSPQALEWWWAYRVNYYAPQGWVDVSIYDVPAGGADQYLQYRDPVYLRGAMFLDELRSVMGDEAFFAALRLYAIRFAYSQASAAGFFEVFQQQTEQDLTPLIRKYFQNP